MKKHQKKKFKIIVMHQHQDEFGHVFGAPHPVDAEHNNEKTQMYHNITVENVRS
jgi:hypothetical protein